MKTVSSGFTDAWAQKYGSLTVLSIQYKRRYWNGSAYVYESAWTQLTQSKFNKVGQINWRLDTPLLNTVRASNVTLYLDNTDYRWLPTNNTTGVFKIDATATTGYEPFLTKFQVQFGYVKADGTTELVNLFTGVAIDYIFNTSVAYTQVLVSGNEFLLQSSDAQLVSDAFTDEACIPATADGVNKVFTTTSLGVSYLTNAKAAGVIQTQGSGYTISGTNTYNTPATITYVTAPTNGSAMTASGRKWKTLQKIDVLVGLICDQAGITAGNRTISSVLFPGGLSANKTITTQSDWQAGTVQTNIDTISSPGQIARNWFLLADGTSLAPFSGGLKSAFTIVSSKLSVAGFVSGASGLGLACSSSVGTREAQIMCSAGSMIWLPFCNQFDPETGSLTGYALQLTNSQITLYRYDTGWDTKSSTLITAATSSGTTNLWRVTRDSSGNFNLYKDGIQVGTTATDNTYTSFSKVGLSIDSASNTTGTFALLYMSSGVFATGAVTNSTAVWESAVLDLLNTPTAWGLLGQTQTLNSGTIAYATASSTDGTTFDAYVAISGGNVIQSALKRYVKVRATITPAASSLTSPNCSKLVVNFTTSVVNLAMANLSGQTCFTAVQNLAKLCDYEWGFDASGNFFFRSKTTNLTPVLTINQSNMIGRVTDFRPGYDAVINVGQVTYNSYYSEYNSATLPETSPTSQQRFLNQILSESQSILLALDVNIASGRAQLIHDNNYLPKRRMKIAGKIIPQLELSDVIGVSFYEDPLKKDNVFGDPLQTWFPAFGKANNVLARDVNCKVIGIVFDADKCTGEYDVQEVF